MKKSTPWIILALLLVFAAGGVVGVFCERWVLAKKPAVRRPGTTQGYPSIERWTKDLDLTAEQQEKIREIFKKNDGRIKELRSDFYKHVGDMRDEMKKEIDAVLTPGQKKKMDAMIQKAMEEHRKANEKRDKSNESQRNRNPKKENANEKETSRRGGDPGDPRGSHPGFHPY